MDLYKLKQNKLDSIERENFKLEKEIQSIVEDNLETLFNLKFVSTEFIIGDFRLDSLCYDNETNSFVIIEYKKGSSYSVIDQGYSYLSVMLNNKSDFILEYIEKTGENLKKDTIDWSQSRIIFISPSFNSYQKNSVNFKDVPFELWEIRKFYNGIISFNQFKSSSKESIQKVSGGKNTIIDNVNKEVQVLSDEDTLKKKKVNDDIKDLYYLLKEKFLEWDDVSINPKKNYVSFKKNKHPFVTFNFRKNFIRIHINIGWKDSKKPKPYFKLDDPKGMFKVWENKYKQLYSYDLKNSKEIDYFVLMVKQKYDFLS
ncbi:MAG: hypothetical protein CMG74_01350 [Candidatus Marinimicrobia bacterium]|nr:hypothetical protein [Candidatus Neomarinimicrobiota bacterium]|tara:strand:- start:591 stop:1529 length:939 start_codon:yes stop_codon:yes gene_type:complete